jgi:hypothetical protein
MPIDISALRIGPPVKHLPARVWQPTKSKYAAIYKAAIDAKGWWVPVTFGSPADAQIFRNRARPPRGWKLAARLYGDTVYLQVQATRLVPPVPGSAR